MEIDLNLSGVNKYLKNNNFDNFFEKIFKENKEARIKNWCFELLVVTINKHSNFQTLNDNRRNYSGDADKAVKTSITKLFSSSNNNNRHIFVHISTTSSKKFTKYQQNVSWYAIYTISCVEPTQTPIFNDSF